MTKLEQKLQISHFDVIRALRYWRPVTHITMHTDTMVQFLSSSFPDGMSFLLLNHMVLPFKWNSFDRTIAYYNLNLRILPKKIDVFVNSPFVTIRSKGVNTSNL